MTTPYGTPGTQPTDSGDQSTAILAHLISPILWLLSAGSLTIVGPLVMWLVFKDRPLTRKAAAGSFNFTLSFWIVSLVLWALAIFTLGIGLIVTLPVLFVMFLVAIYVHIKGAMRASRGEFYDYPFQIRVLS